MGRRRVDHNIDPLNIGRTTSSALCISRKMHLTYLTNSTPKFSVSQREAKRTHFCIETLTCVISAGSSKSVAARMERRPSTPSSAGSSGTCGCTRGCSTQSKHIPSRTRWNGSRRVARICAPLPTACGSVRRAMPTRSASPPPPEGYDERTPSLERHCCCPHQAG